MRIALTGATGFLGRAVTRALHGLGHQIAVIARPGSSRADLSTSVSEWHTPDPAGLAAAVTGASAVIHLATCYGRSGEGHTSVLDANLLLPIRLLEAATAAGVSRALLAHTSLPPALSPYSLAKHQAAEWVRWFPSVRSTLVTLEHFYGPGDDAGKFTARVINACRQGERLALTEGLQERDFIYIDDAVSAIVAILLAGDAPAEVDVGSGTAVTVRSFVEEVHRQTGARSHLDFGAVAVRAGEPPRLVADLQAISALGWKPTIDLRSGIARAISGVS